jgi:maltose alpha-D-glucosyltransferase/alpha-amylase
MVRSFSYAAWSGLARHLELHKETRPEHLQTWARMWESAASSAFLRAYRETIAARPELLPGTERAQALFSAYLLEKALYELLYELNNRPTWLHIPLSGILSM